MKFTSIIPSDSKGQPSTTSRQLKLLACGLFGKQWLETCATRVSTHLLIVVLIVIATAVQGAIGQTSSMARVRYKDVDYFGWPLQFDGQQVALLAPDGRLSFVPLASRDELHQVHEKFIPWTPHQIQQSLLAEFGTRYDISVGESFVVVHPWGDPVIWAKPLEVFHTRFVEFFQAHGFELKEPVVPMIAIVLRSRSDFNRYLVNEIDARDSRIAGYYSQISNRITAYDPGGKLRVERDPWMYQAPSIIHEATHQSAFNRGVHNRFAPPPKWLSEGLAMLFEARGFNHAIRYTRFQDRLNPVRLSQLRKYLKDDLQTELVHLISDDRIFETHPEMAYALSWGLSFYLFETREKRYLELLSTDAERPNFVAYPPSQRQADFIRLFGNDVGKLGSDLNRYYQAVLSAKSAVGKN